MYGTLCEKEQKGILAKRKKKKALTGNAIKDKTKMITKKDKK